MSEEKEKQQPETEPVEPVEPEEKIDQSTMASRARNRTVVLTPDMAGQVRAMLHGDEGQRKRDPLSEILPPVNWENSAPKRTAEVKREDAAREHPAAAVTPPRGSADQQGYARPSRKSGTAKFLAQSHAGENQAPSFTVSPNVPLHSVSPERAPKRKNRIVGFLVSYDNADIGEVFEICQGRWLLTCRPSDQGDQIVVDDPTISPLHAIVRVTAEGKVQVLDQLSEHGTGVTKVGAAAEEEVSGSMVSLEHGDRIRFGKRHFVVCLIPVHKSEPKAS